MAAKPSPSKSVKVEPAKAGAGKAKSSKAAGAKPAAAASAKLKVKPARASSAAGKPATAPDTFYVSLAPLKLLIHSGAPTKGTAAAECSSFAAAKDRAIEELIGLIEEAERRLQATRRAATFAEYQRSSSE